MIKSPKKKEVLYKYNTFGIILLGWDKRFVEYSVYYLGKDKGMGSECEK